MSGPFDFNGDGDTSFNEGVAGAAWVSSVIGGIKESNGDFDGGGGDDDGCACGCAAIAILLLVLVFIFLTVGCSCP